MKLSRLLLIIVAIALVIEGFRLATQAGMTGLDGSIQNDGYAMSGGILILLGGSLLGWLGSHESESQGSRRAARHEQVSKR